MNSQEELIGCLWQLTEALAPNCVRRLSIARHPRPPPRLRLPDDRAERRGGGDPSEGDAGHPDD
jgi:hypothetical protein